MRSSFGQIPRQRARSLSDQQVSMMNQVNVKNHISLLVSMFWVVRNTHVLSCSLIHIVATRRCYNCALGRERTAKTFTRLKDMKDFSSSASVESVSLAYKPKCDVTLSCWALQRHRFCCSIRKTPSEPNKITSISSDQGMSNRYASVFTFYCCKAKLNLTILLQRAS